MQRYEREASQLTVQAATNALIDAVVDPQQLTHLVTVSCSGFSAPGVDLDLIEKLGLNRTVSRTHVGFMGCHGALNGLRVARAIALSEPDAIVMVCAVELCTLHYQYGWDPQKIVANSLFADGAAAVVGRGSVDRASTDVALPGGVVGNYSFVVPDTADMMTWKIGDHGFEMTLSPEVPGIITRYLPSALSEFLGRFDLTISDVRSWAVHPEVRGFWLLRQRPLDCPMLRLTRLFRSFSDAATCRHPRSCSFWRNFAADKWKHPASCLASARD